MGWHFLIADDEQIERMAMKKMITGHLQDVDECGEAANGHEAVEYVKHNDPDIIFMDIQMPGMDGIEAVRQIKRMKPNICIIMVSAYDTFQYAQQVMREGVKDYLLKPSKKQDIIETVDRVLKEIKSDRQAALKQKALEEKYQNALTYIQSDWVTSLLQDQMWLVDSGALVQDSHGEFSSVFAMVVQMTPNGNVNEKRTKDWYKKVRTIVVGEANGLVGPITSGQIPILLPSREHDEDVSDQHRGIMLAKKIIKISDEDFNIKIGIGLSVPSVEEFSHSYHQALTALAHTVEHVAYLTYSGKLSSKGELTQLIEKEQQLIHQLWSGDYDNAFEAYFNEVVLDANGNVQKVRERFTETRILLERLLIESGMDIKIPDQLFAGTTIYQLREEAIAQLALAAKLMTAWRVERSEGAINQAKQYITEHYKASITLEEVAGKVQLSPYYFSKLFKEEAGVTFIEWLSTYRIEKAKKLLSDTTMSLKEICYEVGYHDPNYFSRVFRKMTGTTPTDYRRKQ